VKGSSSERRHVREVLEVSRQGRGAVHGEAVMSRIAFRGRGGGQGHQGREDGEGPGRYSPEKPEAKGALQVHGPRYHDGFAPEPLERLAPNR
jgi:hypothetical protein